MLHFARFGTICSILKTLKTPKKRVSLLVKLQVPLLHGCFSRFLDCTNGIKLSRASHHHLNEQKVLLPVNVYFSQWGTLMRNFFFGVIFNKSIPLLSSVKNSSVKNFTLLILLPILDLIIQSLITLVKLLLLPSRQFLIRLHHKNE